MAEHLRFVVALSLCTVLPGCPTTDPPCLSCDASLADAPPPVDAGSDVPVLVDAPPALDAAAELDGGAIGDAPEPLRNQIYTPTCGPADGPAFRIGIFEARLGASCDGDPLRRTLTFAVDDLGGATLPPSPGATITSTMANASGTASDCPGGRLPCRVSSDFSLTFDTVVDDVAVTGSYIIHWVDGSTSEDIFDAMWCVSEPVCG